MSVELAPFTVLFGPNAVGKSNLLEAMTLLASIASEPTFAQAVERGLRGQIAELFEFPPGGLPELLKTQQTRLDLEGEFQGVTQPTLHGGKPVGLRYRVALQGVPRTGDLTLADEYLDVLKADGTPRAGEPPRIERGDAGITVRHRLSQGRGREAHVPLGSPFAVLADRQLAGKRYPELEAVREQLRGWEFLYLEPRHAMRAPQGPRQANGIGAAGEWLAPFLMGLAENRPSAFAQVRRLLQRILPSIEDLQVGLDDKRGLVDVTLVQEGTPYSLRVMSEGTLRTLALACVVANPDRGRLIAFEEPENGVHPARLHVIEELLHRLSKRQQVVVTTHSLEFAQSVARRQRESPETTALLRVTRRERSTRIQRFDPPGELFEDSALRDALRPQDEEGVLRDLIKESWLDA